MIYKSFIPVSKDSDFPIQNLPYGVFTRNKQPEEFLIGCAIGDLILNLSELEKRGMIQLLKPVFQGQRSLNAFMALGKKEWTRVRERISSLLREDNPILRDQVDLRSRVFERQSEVTMQMPAEIGDYTDFYSSAQHATNIGVMIRDKNNPLLPNWKHLPVAYHGRASSVVVSGHPIRRPQGQILRGENQPVLAPCERLDFEMEMAFLVGTGNALGSPIPLQKTEDHIFGFVMMNDWSARDIQRWEYQPLGPFVSKSFVTSVSPWVVPLAALEPFRTEGPVQDPVPLSYLQQQQGSKNHYSLQLEVLLKTAKSEQPERISLGNMKSLYWSIQQQLAHHSVTGCNMRTGDLVASGTISGDDPSSYGSLMELAWNATKPLVLKNGETRTFLQDGDQVVMRAYAETGDYRIGFGELRGTVQAS